MNCVSILAAVAEKWKNKKRLLKMLVSHSGRDHGPKGHYTNISARIPDTPEARELLKKVGATVCRDHGFRESKMKRML
ncbi:hypothetical protein [Dehalococcoides mccartyi]|uniref:hypothetical protein n=1 Tax=Dehalococcoides mccartyi TaxID=61435 RepID=UPI000870D14A|nr:hypothetical protein [Dehalococcoides mccartyi]AOV98890.1 hypothetical protein DCWBC2_0217 [Dehalococcoides mccartyi]